MPAENQSAPSERHDCIAYAAGIEQSMKGPRLVFDGRAFDAIMRSRAPVRK